MIVDALMKQIEELPERDRGELLDRLDHLYGSDPESPVQITEGLRRLLEERDEEFEADSEAGYSWEEVVAFVKRPK